MQDIKQFCKRRYNITPETLAAFRRLLAEIDANPSTGLQRALSDVRPACGGVEVDIKVFDCTEFRFCKETVLISPSGELVR